MHPIYAIDRANLAGSMGEWQEMGGTPENKNARNPNKGAKLKKQSSKIRKDSEIADKRLENASSEYGAFAVIFGALILSVAAGMWYDLMRIDPLWPTSICGLMLVCFTGLAILPKKGGKTRPLAGFFTLMALLATFGTVLFGAWGLLT